MSYKREYKKDTGKKAEKESKGNRKTLRKDQEGSKGKGALDTKDPAQTAWEKRNREAEIAEKYQKLTDYQPKMETAKQRRLELRMPTVEMAERWKAEAKRNKQSISKFVVEHVESSLDRGDKEDEGPTNKELLEENLRLKRSLTAAEEDKENRERIIEDFKEVIKSLKKDNPFYDRDDKDVLIMKDFVEKVYEMGYIRSRDVLKTVEVSPTNIKCIKLINFQLDNLEDCGILNKVADGWKWKLK